MRNYETDFRMYLLHLEVRGDYGFFVLWNYNEEGNSKNAQVIRYKLSTGEQTTIYSTEYGGLVIASVVIAVTESDVFVAASTTQSEDASPDDTWGTSEITRISIENGEKTDFGEVPLFVEHMEPLSTDRILLIGEHADDCLPCTEAGGQLYTEIISSGQGGEIIAMPEETTLRPFPSGYGIQGSYMESNGINTYYVDSPAMFGTGTRSLLNELGEPKELCTPDGLAEIAASDAQALYLINDTGTQFMPVGITRLTQYSLADGKFEDLAVPTSVGGASLYDADNRVGDWLYLRYNYFPETFDAEMTLGPLCRYNIKTGELVDTANAVYTDENDTTPSAPADATETEEPQPQPETETSLSYTSPLESCKVNRGFYRNDGKTYHGGVDFKAAVGTPVRAVVSGKVVYADRERRADKNKTVGLGGAVVLILGVDGYYYYYAHLSEPLLCEKGDVVASGQVIAKSGRSTRTASGEYSPNGAAAHLHLTIAIPKGSDISIPDGSGKNGTGATEWFGKKEGVAIDPVAFLKEKGVL